MRRALYLAANGRGHVSPNPLVGCVIVHEDVIIGEGYHQQYGGPHAEVNAIQSVKDKSLLPKCTVYVTLEPCSHVGKTPPCADMLIETQVKEVVVACVDPNPLVAGRGLKKLAKAGITVIEGVLEQEARNLNVRFFTFHQKKRPYVILKWAQTNDGFIARENYDSKWISHAHARQWVHKWRAEEDAILVGKNTARYDKPALTVRDWTGNNPLRILLDHMLAVPETGPLFDQTVPTIIYNLKKSDKRESLERVKLDTDNFEHQVLKDLHGRGIGSVIIEGGAATLKSFIHQGLWDEARVFTAPHTFEKGIMAPDLPVNPAYEEMVSTDKLTYYFHG